MGTMHEVRTNIVIDGRLMKEAMRLTRRKTKRETVEEALRLIVQLKRQRGILALRGRSPWVGDLDEMRAARFRDWEQGGHDSRAAPADTGRGRKGSR